MNAKRGVTLRSQWLGKQLRELREAANLTLKETGEFLQRDGSTVSRFEAGLYPARTPDVIALLDLYGVTGEQRREGLIRLSRDVWQSGWWDNYSEDLSLNIVDYAWLESRAQRIRSFDAFVIPGLLQTREYMNAMIRAEEPTADPEQVDRWIRFRQTRQQVLTVENAPNLIAVLDEATLRRRVGGSEIMCDQLAQLVASANQTNIEIRVLPLTAGAHASPDGAFRIFELPGPYPAVAYVPSPAGAIYVEAGAADRLTSKFDRICNDSLSPKRSIELITAIAEKFHQPA
ncbi:helix-turn-helix domain-containing protein [Streptosporangium sp. NBC_01755]|uniref:helix-turn-helix domain-containing protein n=1 Tax=unclassified Streptosporangium TaxID=2632669 RepID=UPI002DD85B3A|nr:MULTISPECIES: helix-turn-helix transcriptional regulator [unclassified Streptosporangium]WSA24268.1 helix-turn-helix domain-containing protein [Streptosporangium sp. NBC_01810]WSC97657.1 helix-turn-helix domain-containing protein [Streptosporangium sp. NBC_01755]